MQFMKRIECNEINSILEMFFFTPLTPLFSLSPGLFISSVGTPVDHFGSRLK